MKKRILTLAIAGSMIMGSVASAAPYDLVHETDSTRNYSFFNVVDTPSIFDYVADNAEDYLMEGEGGKQYKLTEVAELVKMGKTANEAMAELQPVEPVKEEFKVIDISSIDDTGITVNFLKLDEALKAVTITVLDPEGNVIAVQPLDLDIDQEEATFLFIDALEEVKVGTWKVGEKEYEVKEDIVEELKVVKVSAINGTVTVSFDEDVTEVPEGLVVTKDGQVIEPSEEAFVVVEGKVAITVDKVVATEEEQTVLYGVTLNEGTEVVAKLVVAAELTEEEKALVAAQEVKIVEINAVVLTEEETAGKTEDSIVAANEKLAELKAAAIVEVEEAETVEAVNAVEVDTTDALALLEDKSELGLAQEVKIVEINAVVLTEEETAGKTEDSIVAANEKLAELKAAAIVEVEEAETVEAVNAVEVDTTDALALLVDEVKSELELAQEAKIVEINAVVLTEEETAGKTEDSIVAANEKLAELKAAAIVEVEEAETVEAVNAVEVDKTEAVALLVEEEVVLTVESVSVIDATTLEVTFGEDSEVTVEDIKDEILKLTDKDGEVIEANYRDGSLVDGKAAFDLPLDSKLVDAATYSAELGGTKLDFVAKVKAPYAKKFNVTTTELTATAKAPATPGTKSIFFEAVDQFGDAIDLTAITNLKAEVKYNNLPLNEATPDEYDVNVTNGKLEVVIKEEQRPLVKGAKVEVKVETFDKATSATDAKVIETSTASFTVIEGEASIATTIEPIKATYKVTVGDTQKVGDKVTEVLPNNEITLTTEVKDQYGNPVADATSPNKLVRWVVKEGKDLIAASGGDDLTSGTLDTNGKFVNFKAEKPGTVTVVAYNIANGASQTYTVEIAASKLAAITVDTTGTVKDADDDNLVNATPFNKEEAIVAVLVADPTSALLKAEDVKFEVKTSTKDVTKADLVVKAEKITVGKGTNAKDHIVVKATSDKKATFTVTPYIGESFEKATIKGTDITVSSIANPTVDAIELEAIETNELQVGNELVKSIKFLNKHGEKINVAANELTALGTAGLKQVKLYQADGEGKKVDTAITGTEKVAFIGLEAKTKGAHTLNLVAGPKSVSVALTAVEAGKVQSLTLGGGSTVSVIMADSYDTKDETDNIVIKDSKAYTLIPVSAKDTYGVDVKLNSVDLNVTDKDSKVEVEYFSDLKGTVTTTDVKYIGVHAQTDAETGTFTVDLASGSDLTAVEGFVAPSKQITVKAARKSDKATVTPTSLNLGLGGTATIKVNVLDQYGKAFNLTSASEVSVTAPTFTISDKKQSTDAKGTIVGQYEFKAEANDTGSKTIEVDVAGVTPKSTVTVNVAPASDVVESVEITGKGVKDGQAEHVLKAEESGDNADAIKLVAVGKDANGAEVNVNPLEVIWKTSDATVATVDGGIVTTKEIAKEDKNAEVTITADIFGKKQSITFTVSSKPSVLAEDTLEIENAKAVDADKDVDGVQIVLDENADADKAPVVTDGAITVEFKGLDQYGKEMTTDLKVIANSFNASIAKVTTNDQNKVTITAVKAGKTQVRVVLGNDEILIPVEVKQSAVDAAQGFLDAAAYAEQVTEAEAAAAALLNEDKDALAEGVDQDAIDAAQALVGELETEDQTTAQADIDAAQGFLDAAAALQEATDAVGTAETEKTNAARTAAQDLVTALPDGAEKTALQDRLDLIVTAEDQAAAKVQALSDLNDKIDAATQAKTNATEGVEVDNNIVGSGATLQEAIDTATGVKNAAESKTTQELTGATSDLNTALTEFNNAKVASLDSLQAPTPALDWNSEETEGQQLTGAITGYTLGDNESFNVKSSDPETVAVDNATGLDLTAKKAGGPITITVQVKKDGQVIKTGTVEVTVENTGA